ncbi:MAG: TlpA disulfide reductase family protein [Hyphomonas sp.]|uniref:TlpA family protein disulfide reductase n=1 Tax=Hyphomonas sp. TaxID=87 RepID=UPI003529357E
MTRYALAGLFMVGLIAIVYVLMSAGAGKTDTNPYAKFATGAMEKLDFTTAGDPASESPFLTADGGTGSLADLRGKVILVNFWATWCSPCEKEMPSLGALEKARGGEDFEVVAISVDAEADLDYAAGRLGALGAANIAFRATPPERDNYDLVYASGVQGFPTSIIYDREGKEIARLSGDADWASFEAVGLIDALLEGR